MLHNIILYLTSTSAQVWAALMVFQILVTRDLAFKREASVESEWAKARLYWSPLIRNLTDPNAPTLRPRLGEFGLDLQTIHRADTDRKEFIKLIQAIKTHNLVNLANKSAHFAERNEQLSPQAWQSKFNPIAEEIEQLLANPQRGRAAFREGLLAIGANLLIMGLSRFYCSDEAANSWFILIASIMNLSFLIRFWCLTKGSVT